MLTAMFSNLTARSTHSFVRRLRRTPPRQTARYSPLLSKVARISNLLWSACLTLVCPRMVAVLQPRWLKSTLLINLIRPEQDVTEFLLWRNSLNCTLFINPFNKKQQWRTTLTLCFLTALSSLVWIGIKYIFNHKSRYEYFDEFILKNLMLTGFRK